MSANVFSILSVVLTGKHPELGILYRSMMRETHKPVQFSDGSKHLIPIPEAIRLLAIPLKERHYHGK